MKKTPLSLFLTLCTLIFFCAGCTKEQPVEEPVENTLPDNSEYTETSRSYASANIYEITENPYIEGLDYELSPSELVEFEVLFQQASSEPATKLPAEDEVKYIINFYNQSENELLTLAIDVEMNIYSADGNLIKNTCLISFFEDMIAKNQ